MIRSIYTSGWSMLANTKQMDVISNNLANANTNGFKKDTVVFESFPSMLTKRMNDTKSPSNPNGDVGKMQLGKDVGEVFTNFTQGQLVNTTNNLDLSLDQSDSAFFTIGVADQNGDLKEYYTRDGAFSLDTNKMLVTKDGDKVMGANGPIQLSGENFTVESDGTIIEDGKPVDKLLIKDFGDLKGLKKFGKNLSEKAYDIQEREFKGIVRQGFIEQSNVNTIKEMVDMISVMRSYEASQKVLQSVDGTLQKVVNEVGTVR